MTIKCKDLKADDTIVYQLTRTLCNESFEIFGLAKVIIAVENKHIVVALPITGGRDSNMFIPFKNIKAVLNSNGVYKEFGSYNGFWFDVEE